MKIGTKNLSMKIKIMAVLIGSVLLIAGAALFEMRQSYLEAKQESMDQFLGYADALDDSIGAQFFERYGDVQAFASNPNLVDYAHPATITAALDTYVQEYGIYDVILVVDNTGSVVASNSLSPAGKPINSEGLKAKRYDAEPWFQAVMAGKLTEDKAKGFSGTYFEDAALDPIVATATGESSAITTGFSAPIKDPTGRVIGVITNRANFKWVDNEVKLAHNRLVAINLPSSQITILNKDGFVISEYDANSGKTYKRDFDTLFKVNLFTSGSAVGKELKEGHSGSIAALNMRKQVDQIAGYQQFDCEKFPKSIGWSGIVRSSEDELLRSENNMKSRFLIVTSVVVVIISLLSWVYISGVTRRLTAVSDKLREASDATTETSSKLTAAAEAVAESSTEQSAAVQETVSSMSEISSMIGQTNAHVKECTAIASTVTTQSEIGNQTMRRLASTMDSVSQANAQLQNIANIINEVSAKTAVINDIVFKTQLLSINASIEAARAGQHGKGFSVVAEEVGNLATMSGAAAKEIQLLISDSQKQVGQIVEVTQSRAREGQTVSSEALAAFSQIAEGIQSINGRLQGVAQASREQEVGIQQITTAMGYMDKTTQQNSAIATETSAHAKELGAQSIQVSRIMRALRTLVNGAHSDRVKVSQDVVSEIIGDDTGREEAPHAPQPAATGGLNASAERIAARLPGADSRSKVDAADHDGEAHARARAEDFGADDPEFRKSA